MIAALLVTTAVWGHPHRSHAAIAAFKRAHPCPATGAPRGRCPATGAPRGRCPGYVIDHVRALCAGGPDVPSNMQWQTVAEGKAKDRTECKR